MKLNIFFLNSLILLWISLRTSVGQELEVFLKSEKPNFILIVMDDLGFSQVGWTSMNISADDYDPLFLDFSMRRAEYSSEQALEFARRSTPTMSRMANSGLKFSNAFAPSNLCAPSRIAMATGINPNRWGVYQNTDIEALGPKPGSLLAERLKSNGYATGHVGKWHLGNRDESMLGKLMEKNGIQAIDGKYPPLSQHPEIRTALNASGYNGSTRFEHHALNNGFDYYFGYNMWESPFYNADNVWDGFEFAGINPQYNTDLFTDKAISFVEQSIEDHKPFYLNLSFHAVHAPLNVKAPDKYFDEFDSESFDLNNFYAHVYAVDESVRRLEQVLKDKGQAENTVFVFISDNGGSISGHSPMPGNAPYRGQKGDYLLGGIRVPMFIYWPKGIVKPMVSDMLVSGLDILPTFLDAAKIEVPEGLDGKSLLPLLSTTDSNPVHDYLLFSGIHSRAWGFMIHSSYFNMYEERERCPAAWGIVKDGYILRFVTETEAGLYHELPDGKPAYTELYHYFSDPGEITDLLEKEPEKVKELYEIWKSESAAYPPPVRWRKDLWEVLMN
jgi:uncharacterized sulfatase